jgi:ABC-type cobalamin/Fe3+-siderophores transport system ATPase subunit
MRRFKLLVQPNSIARMQLEENAGKQLHDSPAAIDVSNIKVSYSKDDQSAILSDLFVKIPSGKVTAIVGSNGSGKSTLLRTMARLLKPAAGTVYLDGHDIAKLPTKEVARKMAILPQGPEVPPGITVRDLVSYGRHPYQGLMGGMTKEDKQAVDWAIKVTGLERFVDRAVDTLSGGERQRAWIALALAQRTKILLLDEPATFLDIHHELEILTLVQELSRVYGITVGWVLHNLNNAAAYSDHIVMLRSGKIFAEGSPADIMTPPSIREVFGIDVIIIPDPETGNPICLPRKPQLAIDIQKAE